MKKTNIWSKRGHVCSLLQNIELLVLESQIDVNSLLTVVDFFSISFEYVCGIWWTTRSDEKIVIFYSHLYANMEYLWYKKVDIGKEVNCKSIGTYLP